MTHGKVRNLLPFRLVLLLLMALVFAYLGVGFVRQVGARQQRREELRQLEQQVMVAQRERAWLEERLLYVQSPEAAEEWARQNGWVRDSEVSVVLVAPSAAPVPVLGGKPEDGAEPSSNREAWWALFFGEP